MARKWIKSFVCAMALIVTGGTISAYAAEMVSMRLWYDGKMNNYKALEVKVTIDGVPLAQTDMPPVVIDDRTLVPVRAITEAMGAEVSWNDDLKEAYITWKKDIVVLQLENKTGSKNGVAFTMDVPPKAINDRTMIPVRAFSEAFQCDVAWQEATRTVAISTEGKSTEPETPVVPETPTVPETPVVPETPAVPETPTVPETPVTPTGERVRVTSVNIPAADSQTQSFTIQTSGIIGKYEEVKLDDTRIVVDIYNAEKALSSDNIAVNNHAFVSGIRSAQHDMDGAIVTRVVFDLKSAAGYTISKSADQKAVLVTFQKNTITNIDVKQSDAADVVTISAQLPVSATVTQSHNPRKLVIKMPNCQNYAAGAVNVGNANYITSGMTSMSGDSTIELTLNLNAMVNFTTTKNGNQLVVRITKSTLSNMSYDSASHTLTLEKSTPVNVSGIQHADNYLLDNYKLTLPGNYMSAYGYGTYPVDDDVLKDIQVSNVGNNTVFQFNTKLIRAFTVTEDNNNYYIHVKSPKEVYSKVLVLDAGHGAQDPGTNGNGLIEKNLNLIVATKIYEKMQNETGIKTYITRLDDSYPTNPSRAAMANQVGDLFVSVHMNSVAGSTLTNGTELLYTPHANETSGKLTSQIAATVLQKKLVAALGTTDRGIKNRPDLLVLNQTKVPAVIVEVAFLSNPGDALKVSTADGQEKAAQAIYEGIIELMNNYQLR